MNESIYQDAERRTDEAEALLGYYHDDGCKLVRLSRKTKKNVDTEWQLKDIPLSEIVAWWQQGGNVGKQLGEVSDWRAGVDCDCPEAVKLAPKFLPDTLRLGKGSGVPDVYLYRSPELGFAKFKDLDGETLIDLKASNNGAGHQIVVPPSIHPEKGPYWWERGYNPAAIAEVPANELRATVGALAVATLIARHLPDRGRHDLAMALVGYMLRNGEPVEDVEKMLTEAWAVRRAPRNHIDDVRRIVADTARRLARSEPATGGRTLEELMPGMPAKIAKFLGWERADNRDGRRHYTHSDLGNAERFVDMHGDRVRWCPARKSWLVNDGKRWVWDERGHATKLAHEAARSIFKDAAHEPDEAKQKEIAKFAVSSQNKNRIDGMLSQAKPYLAVGMDELDREPWVLNCQNGTLDLRTGELRPHDPADLITRLAPVEYDPQADCPRFKQFLKETLVDDTVISFVQRYSGYTLTGITRERLLAILHGSGKNGKTTLVELLQDVMGDYATNTDTETILAKRYQGVGNDVAALKGARFVSAAEVEQGRRLAESKVKQLTGTDTVTARFLFGEPFNFRPAFKLWLSTNNKPIIQGTDDAIWDRIRLVPFTERFEGARQDPQLPDRLRAELPGVLAWLVDGCLKWQEHGLGEPEQVAAATQQYREEMDTLAAFIEDRCVLRDDATAPATPLYQQYRMWCENAGEKPDTQKMFGMRLRDRGFENRQATRGAHKGLKIWLKIGLKVDDGEPEPPSGGGHSIKKPPRSGGNGLPGQNLVDDRLPSESGSFAGKTQEHSAAVDDSRQTNQKVPLEKSRDEEVLEKRSTSSTSSTHPPRTPSEDQQREIDELVRSGMAEEWARRAVLTADPEAWEGTF